MTDTDLASIGLDALDAHEAEAAKGDDQKGDDDASNTNDDQAKGGTADGDNGDDSNADNGSDADGQQNSDDDNQAGGADDDADATKDDQVVEPAATEPEAKKEEPVVDTTPLSEYKTATDYVNAKLPEVEIRGSDGDDGEIKTFKVRSPQELPDDFVPESHRDMLAASEQFGKNGAKAEELAKEYADLVSKKVEQDFRTDLEQGWLREIDELVADKRLAPITAKENTDEYAKDPTVQRITQISDFMIKENDRLAKAKSPYRIQSVKQALDLMEAQEQRDKIAADKVAADKAEADAIKKRGGMVGGGDSDASKPVAPRVRPGETIDDILARHDELE